MTAATPHPNTPFLHTKQQLVRRLASHYCSFRRCGCSLFHYTLFPRFRHDDTPRLARAGNAPVRRATGGKSAIYKASEQEAGIVRALSMVESAAVAGIVLVALTRAPESDAVQGIVRVPVS